MDKIDKILITIFILILVVVFFAGYMFGTYMTIKAVADIASRFMDRNLIEQALTQYKHNIGNCYPSIFENASLYMGEGN